MVCSICFGLTHNKKTSTKHKEINLSIENLIKDAISAYYCINENINNLLTASTNVLQHNYFEINIMKYSKRHCGYCSDDYGRYKENESNEILYIQIPTILLSKYDCENLDIVCINFDKKVDCYCGKSYEKYIIENFSFNKMKVF